MNSIRKTLPKRAAAQKKLFGKKENLQVPGNRMVTESQKKTIISWLLMMKLQNIWKVYFLCIWMAGIIVILQDSSIKMEFYRRLYRENSIKPVKSRFLSQNPGIIMKWSEYFRMFIAQVILYLENISKVFSREINREIDQRVNGCMWRTRMKGL